MLPEERFAFTALSASFTVQVLKVYVWSLYISSLISYQVEDFSVSSSSGVLFGGQFGHNKCIPSLQTALKAAQPAAYHQPCKSNCARRTGFQNMTPPNKLLQQIF
eukprot:1844294-Amphidinium_carterae.1